MPRGSDSTWKRIFYSRWFLAVLFVLCLFVLFAYARAYYADYQVEKEIERLQAVTKMLQAKKIETLQLLEHVKSNSFVEEQARENLNLVKPGENMAIITPVGTARRQQSEYVVQEDQPTISNPRQWLHYFFK
jgi:cell division protein FtsB